MSQRTRIRTTGAAAPPPSGPPSEPDSDHPKRHTRRNSPGREMASHESDGAQIVAPAAPSVRRGRPAKQSEVSPAKTNEGEGPGQASGLGNLGPEHLARALRAVASELERDPALARRVNEAVYSPSSQHDRNAKQDTQRIVDELAKKPSKRTNHTFTPRVVEGVSATLGTGILDPFAVRAASGEEGLRAALAELRLGSLRAIVREHQLDPDGTTVRGNDAEKLRALILAASQRARAPGG